MKLLQHMALIALLTLFCHPLHAQEAVDSAFIHLPQTLFPFLDKDTKANLLDLTRYHIDSTTNNIFEQPTTLLSKDTTQIHLQLTPSSEWQLQVLPSHRRQKAYYAIIHTYYFETNDTLSSMQCYNHSWKPVACTLPPPQYKDFLPDSVMQNIQQPMLKKLLAQPPHYTLRWTQHGQQLNVHCIISPLLAYTTYADTIKSISQHLKDLHYTFRNGKYVLQNDKIKHKRRE